MLHIYVYFKNKLKKMHITKLILYTLELQR